MIYQANMCPLEQKSSWNNSGAGPESLVFSPLFAYLSCSYIIIPFKIEPFSLYYLRGCLYVALDTFLFIDKPHIMKVPCCMLDLTMEGYQVGPFKHHGNR